MRVGAAGVIMRGGATIYDGKLFRETIDNHVVALDMKTGKQLWKEKYAEFKEGYTGIIAPLVANGVVVTSIEDGLAQVVVRSGAAVGALAEVRRSLGVPLQTRRIGADEFDELISALYNAADAGAAALADDLAQDLDLSRLLQEIPRIEDLLENQNDAPLIRLINALFTQALRDGASDIHIEPFETRSVVRLRIDGTLRDLIDRKSTRLNSSH